MPTEQPSNAPDAPDGIAPRDADTAAGVLHDGSRDTSPGGGGLGPRSATPGTAPQDRKSTRLNSSHIQKSRMPSSA